MGIMIGVEVPYEVSAAIDEMAVEGCRSRSGQARFMVLESAYKWMKENGKGEAAVFIAPFFPPSVDAKRYREAALSASEATGLCSVRDILTVMGVSLEHIQAHQTMIGKALRTAGWRSMRARAGGGGVETMYARPLPGTVSR